MYTLRILTKRENENGYLTENFDLGYNYSTYDRFTKEGKEILKGATSEFKSDFRLLIGGGNGTSFIIKKMNADGVRKRYYIMTENGKTFEALNYG